MRRIFWKKSPLNLREKSARKMVSDSDLVDRLRDILRTSDLNTTTAGTVRRKLEEDFGVDLSDRKSFVRDQIDIFFESHMAKGEDEGEGIDEEESENVKQEEMIKPEDTNETESENDDAEEEEEEEEEEERSGKGSEKEGSNEVDKEVKKRGGGFNKLCSLSPQLQKFVGVPELARTEVVKKLWAYIRENNLQDPKDKRKIICDEALRALFRVDSINMFQMNKALTKHIWPLNVEDAAPVKSSQKEKSRKQGREAAPVKSSQKEKQRKQGREEGPDEPKRKEKRQKGGVSGFLAPLPLSDALVKFFGSGENALSRGDVVKRMWEYIKQNDLQDPSDKRRIICDDKLKELFEVDTFNGFTVSKLLTAHFIKTEQ